MKDLIRHQIERAFPTLPKPETQVAVKLTYGVEHIHERLAGRLWTEPSVDDYRSCDDGFTLLTVSGLHYYLPGYLTAELKDPVTADTIAHCVTNTLGSKSDLDRQRLAELGNVMTVAQITAIGLWLGYYANTYELNRRVQRSYETLEAWASQAIDREQRKVRSKKR